MNKFNTGDSMPITITTRVEEDVVEKIDLVAEEEASDRSTAIRKLLQKATKEWLIEKNLEYYEDGKITLWQAAKKSGISLWEMIEEVKKKDIHVPYTIEDLKDDIKAL